jgi:type II secretory pathway pseudopilin PulG
MNAQAYRAPALSRSDGFTLVEILLAGTLMFIVTGVLLQLAATTQRTVGTQGELAELQQRQRVAVNAIYRDLLLAGAGPSQGPHRGPLADVFAPIVPARLGARQPDAEMSHHSDRISIVYVPDSASQTVLTVGMGAPDAPLAIDAGWPGCPPDGVCGFSAGDRALIMDVSGTGAHEMFTVGAASGGQLSTRDAALLRSYPAGSAVVAVVHRVYYLDRPNKRLMAYDGGQSEGPVIDNVTDLNFRYYAWSGDIMRPVLRILSAVELTDGPAGGVPPNRFDADLLRIGRIRVSMTIETAVPLIGPEARQGRRQVTFDVTPRNMGVFR